MLIVEEEAANVEGVAGPLHHQIQLHTRLEEASIVVVYSASQESGHD